jgi:hypothetical protein
MKQNKYQSQHFMYSKKGTVTHDILTSVFHESLYVDPGVIRKSHFDFNFEFEKVLSKLF